MSVPLLSFRDPAVGKGAEVRGTLAGLWGMRPRILSAIAFSGGLFFLAACREKGVEEGAGSPVKNGEPTEQSDAAKAGGHGSPSSPKPGTGRDKPGAVQRRELDAKRQRAADAEAELVAARNRLAEVRERVFKENPQLRQAYETTRTNEHWDQDMSFEKSKALGWWNNQRNSATRKAMRDISRKLVVKEFALSLEDAASADWVATWARNPRRQEAGEIKARQEWWDAEFVPLPNLENMPPPDVVAALLNPSTRAGVLEQYRISEEEKKAMDPAVLAYLEGAAQAGSLTIFGSSYYQANKGPEIAAIEEEVGLKNQRAVQLTDELRAFEKQTRRSAPPDEPTPPETPGGL